MTASILPILECRFIRYDYSTWEVRGGFTAAGSPAIERNETSPPVIPMTTQEPQDEYADIRDAVAKLCAQFPGEYWRKLDRQMVYPSELDRKSVVYGKSV